MHNRAPWSCGLIHHVLDWEVKGSNLTAAGPIDSTFLMPGPIDFNKGDGKQKKERGDGKWKPDLKHQFHFAPSNNIVKYQQVCEIEKYKS